MITVIEKYRVVNGDKVLEKSIEVGKQEKADKKELQALFNNIQELMKENALNPDNKKYDKHLAFGHKGDLGDKVKQGAKNVVTGKTFKDATSGALTKGKTKDQLDRIARVNKLANQLSK